MGEEDCTGKVELVHTLNNTWLVNWWLLFPGNYAVCHRAAPAEEWAEQTSVIVLAPTEQTCNLLNNGTGDPKADEGHVVCRFGGGGRKMFFFDGFLNEEVDKPHKCVSDCSYCTEEGGTCVCGTTMERPCIACCPMKPMSEAEDEGSCRCVELKGLVEEAPDCAVECDGHFDLSCFIRLKCWGEVFKFCAILTAMMTGFLCVAWLAYTYKEASKVKDA